MIVRELESSNDSYCRKDNVTYRDVLSHQATLVFTDEGRIFRVLSTIGVGALTLPYTTATIGWLQSLLLLVAFFLVSVYNLYLLDFVCRYCLEAFMLLYSFGLSVSYMGVIGTELAVLIPLVIVVAMVPWEMEPPFVDACSDAYRFSKGEPGSLFLVTWHSSFVALLSAVPMFSFCMNAATAFVSIRSEMGNLLNEPAPKDVRALIWIAQTFALLDYLVSGAAGYVSFCQGAPDNVLDGFPLSHWPSLLARLAIALQLTCACSGVYIPLARAALTHLIKGLDSGAPEGMRRIISTVLLVFLMVVVARLLHGALALPLGLTSAICTTAIMFVFPGLCAFTLKSKSNWSKVLPLLFAATGFVIGTASTVTLLTT
ncbi:Threonine--tRNA ligase [Durusdinium trenchii]|uniref:Cytoplasmic n=1 Tax=Durusdinium trenchii TaxID=1381693 RepID=A0ABP0SLU2_9DINO